MGWFIEIDRFVCTDRAGNAVEVTVRQQVSETGLNVTQSPPSYTTADGQTLQRIDRNSFRSAAGEVLTRRAARRSRPS
jgi:hypothetical protein